MSLPNEMMIDGVAYVRRDRTATRVSVHGMYDCHLFTRYAGSTPQEIVSKWQAECQNPDEKYGAPMLCPAIVLDGDKELRRVGPMVFPYDVPNLKEQTKRWLSEVNADPEIRVVLLRFSTHLVGEQNGT